MAEELLFFRETSQEAIAQNTEDDCSLLEQVSWEEYFADTTNNSEVIRKRKISSKEDITHETNGYKQKRPEVCGMNDQVTFDFNDNGFINPDSKANEMTVSSQIVFESEISASIYSEFQNFEESNQKNQKLKACAYLDREENLSSGQFSFHNKNSFGIEDAACEITNTNGDKVANFCSGEDILPLPGSSCTFENISCSKSLVEKVLNVSQLNQQPPIETEQKHLTCVSCKNTITRHIEVHDGKDMYRCCRCPFLQDNFNCLQMHVYNYHTKPYYCNICQLRHSISGSHVRGGTCNVCNQNIECKFQLEEHYILIHKDFLEANCMICKRKLDEHSTFSKGIKYHCCVRECKIRFNSTSSLNQHLGTHHHLKLSKCKVCGNHFKVLQDHIQNVHPLCKSCGKRFVNIYFLYEHLCEKRREE